MGPTKIADHWFCAECDLVNQAPVESCLKQFVESLSTKTAAPFTWPPAAISRLIECWSRRFLRFAFFQMNYLECIWDVQISSKAPSFAMEFDLLENIAGPGVSQKITSSQSLMSEALFHWCLVCLVWRFSVRNNLCVPRMKIWSTLREKQEPKSLLNLSERSTDHFYFFVPGEVLFLKVFSSNFWHLPRVGAGWKSNGSWAMACLVRCRGLVGLWPPGFSSGSPTPVCFRHNTVEGLNRTAYLLERLQESVKARDVQWLGWITASVPEWVRSNHNLTLLLAWVCNSFQIGRSKGFLFCRFLATWNISYANTGMLDWASWVRDSVYSCQESTRQRTRHVLSSLKRNDFCRCFRN